VTIPRNTTKEDVGLTDADAAHALVLGSTIGIPTLFAIVLVVSLTAGASWTDALIIAAWPAVVGGPFFGALVAVGGAVQAYEHRAEVIDIAPVARPPRAAPTRAA
jgi:hypothetical protein